jgi:hypothetical protein
LIICVAILCCFLALFLHVVVILAHCWCIIRRVADVIVIVDPLHYLCYCWFITLLVLFMVHHVVSGGSSCCIDNVIVWLSLCWFIALLVLLLIFLLLLVLLLVPHVASVMLVCHIVGTSVNPVHNAPRRSPPPDPSHFPIQFTSTY